MCHSASVGVERALNKIQYTRLTAASAGIRTRSLSIMSLALNQQAVPVNTVEPLFSLETTLEVRQKLSAKKE